MPHFEQTERVRTPICTFLFTEGPNGVTIKVVPGGEAQYSPEELRIIGKGDVGAGSDAVYHAMVFEIDPKKLKVGARRHFADLLNQAASPDA